MWYLYVLAFLLLLIFLFMIFPFKLNIILDDGFAVKLKLFNLTVFQSDKKSDSDKKKSKKKTKTEQKKSKPDEILKSIKLYFELLKDMLSFLKGYFKKKKIIEKFSFGINYGFDDAAQTGIFTGGMYAFFYPFNTYLTENYSIKEHQITIEPDFNQKIFKIKSSLIIKIKIYSLLNFAVKEGIKYLKYQKEKEGKKNVRSSD